jgi:hypothetical protein
MIKARMEILEYEKLNFAERKDCLLAGDLAVSLMREREDTEELATALGVPGEKCERVRSLLGRRLLNKYKKETDETGAIDWSKFKEWLNEHMGEVNFLRLLVSLAGILLLFL